MRRHYWLFAGVLLACSSEEDENADTIARTTRIVLTPNAFLGDVPCDTAGGMHTYQATLIDVTDGLEDAFVLPHSPVVSCESSLSFELVQEGRRYIAEIVAFDRSDIEQQNISSPVVVDQDGKSVIPRWTTTCWGRDGEDVPALGLGGADNEASVGGAGGAIELGLKAYDLTTVVMRGCEALVDSGTIGSTSVSVGIESALLGKTCGADPGQVAQFTMSPVDAPMDIEAGGAGGAGGSDPGVSEKKSCGETFIFEDLEPGNITKFTGLAFEDGKSNPTWSTECEAFTVAGISVSAGCSPLKSLE